MFEFTMQFYAPSGTSITSMRLPQKLIRRPVKQDTAIFQTFGALACRNCFRTKQSCPIGCWGVSPTVKGCGNGFVCGVVAVVARLFSLYSPGVLREIVNIRLTILGFYGLLAISSEKSWGSEENVKRHQTK